MESYNIIIKRKRKMLLCWLKNWSNSLIYLDSCITSLHDNKGNFILHTHSQPNGNYY